MSDKLSLCNKKGKLIKDKPTPWLDPDHYDAIDVNEKRGVTRVNVYVITKFGISISEIADDIFTSVEKVFEILRLPKPIMIKINVKGIMTDNSIAKRTIEVVRNNA